MRGDCRRERLHLGKPRLLLAHASIAGSVATDATAPRVFRRASNGPNDARTKYGPWRWGGATAIDDRGGLGPRGEVGIMIMLRLKQRTQREAPPRREEGPPLRVLKGEVEVARRHDKCARGSGACEAVGVHHANQSPKSVIGQLVVVGTSMIPTEPRITNLASQYRPWVIGARGILLPQRGGPRCRRFPPFTTQSPTSAVSVTVHTVSSCVRHKP